MPRNVSQTALLKATEWIGPQMLRAWLGSLRVTTLAADESLIPTKQRSQGIIYAGWHESLLAPVVLYGGLNPYTLVSKSRDGEYISRIVSRLGWQVIRGSARQDKLALLATWDLMDALRAHPETHLFLATDGPRGPRRMFKGGAIYFASRTRRPLVLIGVAHERPWRARSWDRFVLPRPFTRVCLTFSDAIKLPLSVNRRSISTFQQLVQKVMDDLQRRAEQCLADYKGIEAASLASQFPASTLPAATASTACDADGISPADQKT